jgi:predicted regulator of Ras-like GTPase activity (Roadblock/LC7/MglB family)
MLSERQSLLFFTERLNDIRKVTGIRMSQAFYAGGNSSHEMNKTFLHEVLVEGQKDRFVVYPKQEN